MNFEIEYIFPTLSSGTVFYIHQLSEGLGMRKILAYGIRMQKKPHIFWIFMDVHSYLGPKSNLHPRMEISSMESLTLKSSVQAEIRKSEKNSLGELEQNYCDITQHIPRITES